MNIIYTKISKKGHKIEIERQICDGAFHHQLWINGKLIDGLSVAAVSDEKAIDLGLRKARGLLPSL